MTRTAGTNNRTVKKDHNIEDKAVMWVEQCLSGSQCMNLIIKHEKIIFY